MVFKSKKDPLVGVIIWGAVGLLTACVIQVISQGGAEQWMAIIIILIDALLLWMWFGTYYVIEGAELRYRSGPVNGIILIDSIHSVSTKKTMYAGLKPSLASKGCIVKYNKYDEIYLSPKDQDGFVRELLKVNAAIEVLA